MRVTAFLWGCVEKQPPPKPLPVAVKKASGASVGAGSGGAGGLIGDRPAAPGGASVAAVGLVTSQGAVDTGSGGAGVVTEAVGVSGGKARRVRQKKKWEKQPVVEVAVEAAAGVDFRRQEALAARAEEDRRRKAENQRRAAEDKEWSAELARRAKEAVKVGAPVGGVEPKSRKEKVAAQMKAQDCLRLAEEARTKAEAAVAAAKAEVEASKWVVSRGGARGKGGPWGKAGRGGPWLVHGSQSGGG